MHKNVWQWVLLGSAVWWLGSGWSVAQTSPAPAAPTTAELLEGISVADREEAVKQVNMARAYLEQQEWFEAFELLQNLIRDPERKIVPVGPQAPGLFVQLRQLSHHLLTTLPPAALQLYQQRVDPQAREWLQLAERTGEDQGLRQIVNEYFNSSVTPIALERLADRALSLGRYQEALECYAYLLPDAFVPDLPLPKPAVELLDQPQPDQPANPLQPEQRLGEPIIPGETPAVLRLVYPQLSANVPRLATKRVLALLLTGNRQAAQQVREQLQQQYPEASGRLGRESGTYTQIIAHWLAAADRGEFRPVEAAGDWTTFAGNQARDFTLPQAVEVGKVQWQDWFLNEPTQATTAKPNEPQPVTDALQANDALKCHPIVLGDFVYAATETQILRFQFSTGKPTVWAKLRPPSRDPQDKEYRSRYTLTAAAGRLFARTLGDIASQRLNQFGFQSIQFNSDLFCFDLQTGSLLWKRNASAVPNAPEDEDQPARPPQQDRSVTFESAPVVAGDVVCVAMSRYGTLPESWLVGLDLNTGKLCWRTVLCQSNETNQRQVHLRNNVLTLIDQTIYCCSNFGVVAALDSQTGALQWVSVYPRHKEFEITPLVNRSRQSDMNPCYFAQGRLFVAPYDSDSVHCLSASTGQRLWSAQKGIYAQHLLGVVEDTVIVTGDRVWALEVATGRVKWYWPESNPVPGYGRGLIAGQSIFWPTTSHLYVLDAKSNGVGRLARAPIPLQEKLGTGIGGGNLVMAQGYLLIAQPNQILPVVPNRQIIRDLQRLLTQNPNAAALHRQLAQVAFEGGEFALAANHFRQAKELAHPEETYAQQPLRDHANNGEFESYLAQAAAQRRDGATIEAWQEGAKLYQQAQKVAQTPRQHVLVRLAQARLWQQSQQPQQALLQLQEILAQPDWRGVPIAASLARAALGELLPSSLLASLATQPHSFPAHQADNEAPPNRSGKKPTNETNAALTQTTNELLPEYATALWARAAIQHLLQLHGTDLYETLQPEWAQRLQAAQNAADWLELAAQYPHHPRMAAELLAAAERLLRTNQPAAAQQVLQPLWQTLEQSSVATVPVTVPAADEVIMTPENNNGNTKTDTDPTTPTLVQTQDRLSLTTTALDLIDWTVEKRQEWLLKTMLLLAETLRQQKQWTAHRQVVQRLLREFGSQPHPQHAGQTVRETLAQQAQQEAWPEQVQLPLQTLASLQEWTLPAAGAFLLPESAVEWTVAGEAPFLLRWQASRLTALVVSSRQHRWEVALDAAPLWASLTSVGLLVANRTQLVCLEPATGDKRWQQPLLEFPAAPSWSLTSAGKDRRQQPFISKLLAKFQSQQPLPQFWVLHNSLVSHLPGSGRITVRHLDDGKICWQWDLNGKHADLPNAADPALANDGTPRRATPEAPLAGLADQPRLRQFQQVIPVGNNLWVTLDRAGLLLDGQRGQILARLPLPREVVHLPVAAVGSELIVVAARDTVVGLEATTGKERWRRVLLWPNFALPMLLPEATNDPPAWSTPAIKEPRVLLLVDGYQLLALVARTGETAWMQGYTDRPGPAPARTAFALSNDRLLSNNGKTWECRDRQDGRLLWQQPLPTNVPTQRQQPWQVFWVRNLAVALSLPRATSQLLLADSQTGAQRDTWLLTTPHTVPLTWQIGPDTLCLQQEERTWTWDYQFAPTANK